MSFNKIIIVGNLGRDPDLRYTPQGTPVCKFTLATNERRKGADGEQKDETTWFQVTVWGKQGENASKYLTKGRQVYVEGRLRLEEWTDRDGATRVSLVVNASDVRFLGALDSGERIERGGDSGGGHRESAAPAEAPEEDDIPF